MIESLVSARSRAWDMLMLFALVVATVWTLYSRDPSAVGTPLSTTPSPREGFFAPDFRLDTLDGGKVNLSDLRGKIVIVNFWATWCPPWKNLMNSTRIREL